jgi:UDP-N-acetylglucosamine/UDP-N-acetylgalactosamine diphosphorylase
MNSKGISVKELLLAKGVKFQNPGNTEIGEEVNPDRISGKNVVVYSGCRIYGSSTLILHGSEIGYEGPATVENCYVGPDVKLKGGFFNNSIFLKGVEIGSGAQVREGTIMEEEARAAHCVGLKQTVLFPYVVLGSLVNFCDCFMAGGTSRENHSEVGSSYIHFNYTPNQDKATPSLIGDVPCGVMINQPPIFLGGQGGLVGPSRIAFGTVLAAGSILRKDELRQGRLIIEGNNKGGNISYTQGYYRSIKRVVLNNIIYLANLIALFNWYKNVRVLFLSIDFPEQLYDGLVEILEINFKERVKRFGQFCLKLPDSAELYKKISKADKGQLISQKYEIFRKWTEIEEKFYSLQNYNGNENLKSLFLENLKQTIEENNGNYLSIMNKLQNNDKNIGTLWLKSIVDYVYNETLKLIPTIN